MRHARLTRIWHAAIALGMILAMVIATPAASVRADEREETLFRAEFASAPAGALVGPLSVATGSVVADGGSVAIATLAGEQALLLDGASAQSTALLQWSNYPGALPVAPPPAVQLRISADMRADAAGPAGGSLGLLTGTTFFEFVTLGPSGQLTRDGSPIGLTYRDNERVRVEVFLVLPGGSSPRAQIKVESGGGQRTIVADMGGAFTASTLNQLRARVPSGGGMLAIDRARVEVKQGEQEDDDPPAVIEIDDDDIEQDTEVINGVVFISVQITIINTGGKARGSVLILNLDDLDDLDLAEIGFPEGAGFVREIRDGRVYIGIGENNIIRNDRIKVKIKFKVKPRQGELRVDIRLTLSIRDTSGRRDIPIAPIPILVPAPAPGAPPVTPAPLPIDQIDIRISATWRARGGVVIFGLPISMPITRTDGLVVQYFERARIEVRLDDDGRVAAISFGRLAADLGYGEPPTPPPTDAAERRWYAPQTGHLIAAPFRSYWERRGGTLIFGLPISAVRELDGVQIQYFERVRLERRPALRGTPYEIQIGLLGVEAFTSAGPGR